jgi:uncharacterized protein
VESSTPRKPRPTAKLRPSSLAFVELASGDLGATRSFLSKVFGWRFRTVQMPAGEYLSFRTPGGGQGGIRSTRVNEPPSSLSYIRVKDLDLAQRRVERSGGGIVLPRVDVPGMGSFFWFQVPHGPLMACWQDVPRGSRGR